MSRLPWFKMHCEARTDRKLDLLADDEFRVWHSLLCFAAEQSGKRGFIPDECRLDLAIECARGDDELLERALSRLVTLRMIGEIDGGLLFVHFEERQYDKPSDMPEASRARKARSRAVTPCHAESPLEKSREEESIKTSPCHSIPDEVLGRWQEKARRDPDDSDLRSLAVICKKYPPHVVSLAIGQACVQGGTATSYGLITTICRAEQASDASPV